MTTRRTCILLALLAIGGVAPGACDGDEATTAGDTAGDTAPADTDLTGKSAYHLTLTLPDGEVIPIDRDVTGRESQYFAFGSTHIAPAVSMAMTDSLTFPRTITFTINMGIVVPSETYAIQTPGAGSYPFNLTSPPEVDVFVLGIQFRSRLAGASGQVVVDEWSVVPGETVSGTFSGTLVQDTTREDKKTVTVEGWFHWTLPPHNAG